MSEATSFGYHFFETYRTCQRKWYLQYIQEIEPPVKSDALLKGTAWHDGLEVLLKGGPTELVISRANSIFPSPLWTEANFVQWFNTVQEQLPLGALQSVEGEVQFPLANGILVTARLDGLWALPTRNLFLLEHKTTSYKMDSAVHALEQGDQLTMYILAVRRLYGSCEGAYCDVTLFSKDNKASTSEWLLTRSDDDLIQFELGLIGTYHELQRKVLALTGGSLPEELFPRCPNSCSTFTCPFEEVCRQKLKFLEVPPSVAMWFDQPEAQVITSKDEDSKQFDFTEKEIDK